MEWGNNNLLKFSATGMSIVAAVAFAAYWHKRGISFQYGWRADEVNDTGQTQYRIYGGDNTKSHGTCVKEGQQAFHLINQMTNT